VMTKAVVDILETVKVEEQDRQHLAAACGALQRLVQRLTKQAAIWQFGQFVVIGEEPRALFLLLAFGNVLQHGVQSARTAIVCAAYIAAGKCMRNLVIAAYEPKLIAPMAGIRLYCRQQFFVHACTVVRMNVLEPCCHVWRGTPLPGAEYLRIVFASP